MNFKSFSQSLEHFFLTVGQNKFGNKMPILICGKFSFFMMPCGEVNILVKNLANWTIRILFLTRRWQKNKGTPMCNLQTKMAKKSPRKMSNALDKVHFSAWPDATLLLTQIWLRLSNHYWLHDRALYPWHVSKIYCSAKSSTWHLPRDFN